MDEKFIAQFKNTLSQVFNHTKSTVIYLHDRWLDEKEYEDFAEYEQTLKTKVDELSLDQVRFVRATKRPFGFRVKIMAVEVQVSATNSSVRAKVV